MRTQVRTSADTRTSAVSLKAARGCGVQCRASARKLAASASTATPPVDDTFVSAADTAQPRIVAPEDMQLPSGQLSDVKRAPSASPADVFRCNGCTDTACQVESALDLAPRLSSLSGNSIFLKREDLQPVFSFKLRGAFNKMVSLTPEQLTSGVICSSAGNHAQGVALAAQRLGTSAVICMPISTPEIKVDAVRARGGEVRLVGESYTETQAYAQAASEAENRAFIAPYDDPLTIAGQGTIGAEILKQLGTKVDDLRYIFVAIGGGGLIAGIAAYVKALRPGVQVIGVEPTGANCMAQSLAHGERVVLSRVDAFADGVAVKAVGAETFRLCQEHCEGVVLVDNAQISAAIKDVFTETRTILEPAGAVAVAGAKAFLKHHNISGATCVAVTSGANMNFDRLSLVADLANFGLRTEHMLTVAVPETPGSFKRFVAAVTGTPPPFDPAHPEKEPETPENAASSEEIDITELKYRYSADRDAQILFSLTCKGGAEVSDAVARVQGEGFACRDVSGSEAAQVHLRHLVGGRPRSYTGAIQNEKMAVVTFPEKKGALRQFLDAFTAFNITMFHYRRSGNRTTSALVGIQVAAGQEAAYAAATETLTPKDFAFKDLSGEDRALFDQFIS